MAAIFEGPTLSGSAGEPSERVMRPLSIGILVAGALVAPSGDLVAAVCANGVYRAGCAGPNGAVVATKTPAVTHGAVHCASGVYRAGCVGPNGNAVVGAKAPVYHGGGCYMRGGVRVCP
jgi:hypothetical protein